MQPPQSCRLKSHMHIQLLTLILHSPVPLNQGQRKHFSFGQKYSGAIITYVCAGLGNGLEWWNRLWNDYGIKKEKHFS